jgi:predicted transcriptional regulator
MPKRPPKDPEPRISLAVPAELEKRIREQAKREDRSVSALIRVAVVAYLDAQHPPGR